MDLQIGSMLSEGLQHELDAESAAAKIANYDAWLDNWGGQYAQEVASKQAQTEALKYSGRESYENFLNAIGYADAAAGATGRIGAGTSQAAVTGLIDTKLVEYAGEDRTLDEEGGLFGAQLKAAYMETEQLKNDLKFQYEEMSANRELETRSLDIYKAAIEQNKKNIEGATKSRNELEGFIYENFYDEPGTNDDATNEPSEPLQWISGVWYKRGADGKWYPTV
jgi:hypothetical protein